MMIEKVIDEQSDMLIILCKITACWKAEHIVRSFGA